MIQTPHLDALMSGPWPQWARERKEEAIMSMWAKEGTPAGDLFNLISDYFDAGYLEGKEGRSMDTPDRKADRISSAIHEHLQRYAALVERVEELEAELSDVRKLARGYKDRLDGEEARLEERLANYNSFAAAEDEAKANRYREALEFYADEENWLAPGGCSVERILGPYSVRPAIKDNGSHARQALHGEEDI